jgi:hypothetical protein
MALLVIVVVMIGVVQAICLLALVDQYKGILQIRDRLELRDAAIDLDVADSTVQAADIGLPAVFSSRAGIVGLVFSTRCGSCFTVAEGLKGRVPDGAWAIIVGSQDQVSEFCDRVGLAGDRVLLDIDGQITERLKIRTFPSALLFASGKVTAAKSVPSYRELRNVLTDWQASRISPMTGVEVGT